MQDFLGDLRYRQQKFWREADALSPREVNRKAVTIIGVENLCIKQPFCIPSYLFKDLDKGVVRNVSRFRLRAHCLKVESCKWLGGSNICDKCGCAEVQKEKHKLISQILRPKANPCNPCTHMQKHGKEAEHYASISNEEEPDKPRRASDAYQAIAQKASTTHTYPFRMSTASCRVSSSSPDRPT
eukprot:1140277-Pelagomonas_calceolata.AAC.1